MTALPDRRVRIVAPRPEWHAEFRDIAGVLRAALGPLALRIDHIGSTSVPGLAAKDVIDMQISVSELAPTLVARMDAFDFIGRPEISDDHHPPGAANDPDDWRKLSSVGAMASRRCRGRGRGRVSRRAWGPPRVHSGT